jgi:hypothetical protein
MSALPKLQPVTVRAITKPVYGRWELLRTNEQDAWIAANKEALQAWYNDLSAVVEPRQMPHTFEDFSREQFERERDFFEQLREDAKLDHDYVDREDE